MKPPSTNAIAVRAYALWEQAGRPDGRDQEFWIQAEAQLAAPTGAGGTPPLGAMASTPTSVHQVPPPIQAAVKTPGRRPPTQRVPKRA